MGSSDGQSCMPHRAACSEDELPGSVAIPAETARRLRAVEAATGLPAGTIASKFLGLLVADWIQNEPGELSHWVEEWFEFSGTPEERALITNALYRLETRWRIGASAEEPG